MWPQAKAKWIAQLHHRWEQEVAQQVQEHEQRYQQLQVASDQACAEHDQRLSTLRQQWETQYATLTQEYATREEAARSDYLHAEEMASQLFEVQRVKQVATHQEALATLTQQHLQVQQVLEEKIQKNHDAAQRQLTTMEAEHHALLKQREEEFRLARTQQQTTHEVTLQELSQSLQDARVHVQAQQEVVESQHRDLADLAKRNEDRKVELAQLNVELKQQIRLLEAKAKPDSVWVEAFSRGYEKAWDTLAPLMMSGVEKSKEMIRRVAIDETLANLSGPIQQKAIAMGQLDVREKSELLTKYEMFRQKRDAATKPEERDKYSHYLTALEWALNGHQLPQDQTLSQ
jgi:G:T/U-mismatch repair DNA glycosylase